MKEVILLFRKEIGEI